MKVVYVISLTHKSVGFEQLFEQLLIDGLNFHVILINREPSELFRALQSKKISVSEFIYPGKKSIVRVCVQIYRCLKHEKPTHLHTHLLEGGFLGGITGWLARIPNRIYTRHHADAHHFENKQGRIYDRFIHFFHQHIIALSQGHYVFLRDVEKLEKKLVLIPNFIDPSIFEIPPETNRRTIEKYGFNTKTITVGINARWTKLKGLQYILPALHRVIGDYPSLKIYLFNAKGDFKPEIEQLLSDFDPAQVVCTDFEDNMMSVYPHLTLFLHCPIRPTAESFGLVYIEALGSGVPSIITLSGIANDVVIANENAWVVNYRSVTEIELALRELLEHPEIRQKIGANAKKIAPLFSLKRHVDLLFKLYQFPKK